MRISPYHLYLCLSNLPRRRRKRASRQHLRPPLRQGRREANEGGKRAGLLPSFHPRQGNVDEAVTIAAAEDADTDSQDPFDEWIESIEHTGTAPASHPSVQGGPNAIDIRGRIGIPPGAGAPRVRPPLPPANHCTTHSQSTLTIHQKNYSTGPPSQAAGDHLKMIKSPAPNAGNLATLPLVVASGPPHAPGEYGEDGPTHPSDTIVPKLSSKPTSEMKPLACTGRTLGTGSVKP